MVERGIVRLGGESGNLCTAEHLKHGALRFGPDGMSGAGDFAAAGFSRNQADIKRDSSVDGFDDVEHGCRAAANGDPEAAGLAAPRRDETRPRESLKNLGEKALRRAGCRSQIDEQKPVFGPGSGEMDHHPDSVVGGAGELHRGIGFSHVLVPPDH